MEPKPEDEKQKQEQESPDCLEELTAPSTDAEKTLEAVLAALDFPAPDFCDDRPFPTKLGDWLIWRVFQGTPTPEDFHHVKYKYRINPEWHDEVHKHVLDNLDDIKDCLRERGHDI